MQNASKDCNEEWRPVVGAESWYEVSSLGGVRRAKRGNRTHVGRALKPGNIRGYPKVVLSLGGQLLVSKLVHCLVAEAFLGPRPSGHEINHLDGDKGRAHANNLEYVTPAENMRHAYKMGLRQGCGKLTVTKVNEMRQAGATTSRYELAATYDVSPDTVRRILNHTKWAWLP